MFVEEEDAAYQAIGGSAVSKVADRVRAGNLSMKELGAMQLDKVAVRHYLASEVMFLGRLSAVAALPFVAAFFEELHDALLLKSSKRG